MIFFYASIRVHLACLEIILVPVLCFLLLTMMAGADFVSYSFFFQSLVFQIPEEVFLVNTGVK